jgi:glycerate kinase
VKPPVTSTRYRASTVVCHQECLLGVKLRDPVSGQVRVYLPGGGVEKGELPAAAAKRECLEETGFRVIIAANKSAPHKVLRYPFLWAGRVVDCTTEFFSGTLKDAVRLPDPIADDSRMNLGAVWIPFSEIRDVFGYHQGILDVILQLLDPAILPPEKSVLCAFSAFKGTMSAVEACAAAAGSVRAAGWSAIELPLADGGRGSLDLWVMGMNRKAAANRIIDVQTKDPLGRPTIARVGISDQGSQVFIESADCLGTHLIGSPNPATAMAASSHGLGLLLRDLSRRLPEGSDIHIGLGDSSVSDCGLGMLMAFGFKILVRGEEKIEVMDEVAFNSALLESVVEIQSPSAGTEAHRDFVALGKFKWTVLCDVNHALSGVGKGIRGAAMVFAPQKGALPVQVDALDRGFKKVAKIFDRSGYAPGPWGKVRHGGASGGVAAALGCVFDARLMSGAEWLLDAAGFDEMLATHRLVLTGEGSSDAQSVAGKAAFACAHRAMLAGVSTEIISGRVNLRGWPAWMKKFLGCAVASGREPDPEAALAAAVSIRIK